MSQPFNESFSYIETLTKLQAGEPLSTAALEHLLYTERRISEQLERLSDTEGS